MATVNNSTENNRFTNIFFVVSLPWRIDKINFVITSVGMHCGFNNRATNCRHITAVKLYKVNGSQCNI